MSGALWAYLAASRLAGPVAPLLLRRREARGKEDPHRLGERLGRPASPRPPGQLIWLHGASVGEATSALPMIDALLARSAAQVLLTTGTVTSAQRMATALPRRAQHQYVPVDTADAVRGFLDHWRPDLAVWIESELWPRLIVETTRRGVPMALVNARLSERSAARWVRAPRMARRLLGGFDPVLAQDTETVERLAALGITAREAGNLKAAVPVPDADPQTLETLRTSLGGRPVWLAASTHPGEEQIVADAHRALADMMPRPLLILAPRHPERGGEVADLLSAAGLSYVRRSDGQAVDGGTDVLLADTLGEMGLWYRLAAATFVGGSLAPMGGHTPFEPVSLGSAVLYGPDTSNFAPAYRALAEAEGALPVRNADDLAEQVRRLLSDPAARTEMTARAEATHARLLPDVGAIADTLLARMEGTR